MSEQALSELLVALDRESRGTLRAQLSAALREAVVSGRLADGTRLPPSRVLAQQLGVSRGVVVAAYEQLTLAGYLVARTGVGTVVTSGEIVSEADIGFVPAYLPTPREPRWNMHPTWPDVSAFPRADWLAAVQRVLARMPSEAWGYGDPRGAPELREALARRIARTRACQAAPECIVVTNGSRQAHHLVLRLLAERGARRVAVEDPGWVMQRLSTADAGMEAVPVAIDELGMRVQDLAALDVQAAIVTPAHQFPTGVTLAPSRRAALLDWAHDVGAVVVEDDYDADFRYDGEPLAALQSIDPERVITIGSLSKTFAPALRIGWILAPRELAAAAARLKERMDNGSALLEQLVVADLETSGRLDRHMRRMARSYATRRATLAGALARELPDVRVRGIAAGLHAVVELTADVEEQAVVDAARSRGIALEGVCAYRVDSAPPPAMLALGFANVAEPAIGRAIATLAEAIASVRTR
ncbi:MAG: GntR family transcriptional regulator / MocR family aminotransferase [Solirubrobacteraceae bacterium]|nr:GntR family transcriptional regulator / MocR family aminotransferase [Solirubrobacteraceae bacterium]